MKSFVCLPTPALIPYVSHYCYANYTTKKHKEQGSFPYGGTVISISLKDETYHFELNNVIHNQKSNLAGILETATYIEHLKNHNFFLIFFTPLGIFKLLGIPQSELANTFVDLENIIKDSLQLRELLAFAKSKDQIISIVNSYLLKKINRAQYPDLYDYAIKKMFESCGTIRINTLCDHLNVSQRSFERHFKHIVGIVPKSYNRVLRLQQVYDKFLCNSNSMT